MSYCMRCGKQTDNEDFICDECRRKEGAVSDTAVQDIPAQASDGGADAAANGRQGAEFQSAADNRPQAGWQPRAAAGQPYYNSPYGSVPNTPWAAPYVLNGVQPAMAWPVDRSGLPLNKCGLVGMIFSLAGLFCWIGMLILVVAFVASNPEAFEAPYYQPPESELMVFGMAAFFLLVGAFAFAITGISLSGVGLARYRRYRAVGFAIAGLVIGIIILLITLSMFGLIFS